MNKFFFLSVLMFSVTMIFGQRTFNLSDYSPICDGQTDDSPAFYKMFEDVIKHGGGHVYITAGDYFLNGDIPIPLCSNVTVSAYGTRFFLPEKMGDRKQIVLFRGRILQTSHGWVGILKVIVSIRTMLLISGSLMFQHE